MYTILNIFHNDSNLTFNICLSLSIFVWLEYDVPCSCCSPLDSQSVPARQRKILLSSVSCCRNTAADNTAGLSLQPTLHTGIYIDTAVSRESETDVDSRPMDLCRVTQQPQQHQIYQQQQSFKIDEQHQQFSDHTQTELTPESDKSSEQVRHIF